MIGTTDEYVHGERRYVATIEWKDLEGHPHQHIAYAQSAATYATGQSVSLRYDPQRPEDAHQPGGTGSNVAAAILGVVAALFLFISGDQWARALRKKPKS